MSRRNYRRKRVSEEEDYDEPDTTTELLEERKELQKFRKRPKGVSAIGLALGKELPPEESVVSDPFKLKTGGLVQMNDFIQDRDRDRDDEGTGMSVVIGANFAAETNRRDEDTLMLKYIEEEIARKKGASNNSEGGEHSEKSKSKEDLLYTVPKNIDVRSKLMKSEEMLSNQMLSGIPEVDLGISAKIRNIEATEEAKMKLLEEQRSKKRREPTEMVPTNMASNFMLHSRFFDEQRSVEAESKKAARIKAKEEEEKNKPKGPTVPAVDSTLITGNDADPGAVAVGVPTDGKKKDTKKERSSDDFYYEKFRKRARDNWRYQ